MIFCTGLFVVVKNNIFFDIHVYLLSRAGFSLSSHIPYDCTFYPTLLSPMASGLVCGEVIAKKNLSWVLFQK